VNPLLDGIGVWRGLEWAIERVLGVTKRARIKVRPAVRAAG